jgi:hypothetical protein
VRTSQAPAARIGGSGASRSSAAVTLRHLPDDSQDSPDSLTALRYRASRAKFGQIRFHIICVHLGIPAWIAWLIGAAVDLSVVGLLTGIRFLSLHGYTDSQLRKPRRMLVFCGMLTLALNTAGAISHRDIGAALVDAVGPMLLIGFVSAVPVSV